MLLATDLNLLAFEQASGAAIVQARPGALGEPDPARPEDVVRRRNRGTPVVALHDGLHLIRLLDGRAAGPPVGDPGVAGPRCRLVIDDVVRGARGHGDITDVSLGIPEVDDRRIGLRVGGIAVRIAAKAYSDG